MSSVQTLSKAILGILSEYGEERLKKALAPQASETEENEERRELLSLLDNEI
jgi:hypothetical protein